MLKAWVDADGKIRDVVRGVPGELFHPKIAGNYTANVPDDAEVGDPWDGSTLTKITPTPFTPVLVITPRKISPTEFKLLFTTAERVEIAKLKGFDSNIDDYYALLDDVRLTTVDMSLPVVVEGVTHVLNAVKVALGYDQVTVDSRIATILVG